MLRGRKGRITTCYLEGEIEVAMKITGKSTARIEKMIKSTWKNGGRPAHLVASGIT